MSWEDNLIRDDEILREIRIKSKDFVYESVKKALTREYLDNGWELDRKFKTVDKLKKKKTISVKFEDEVWVLLASLGFNIMNKDNRLIIPYSENNSSLGKQIDILAADEETLLFVECKTAESIKSSNFKKELESIHGYRKGLIKEAKKVLGNNNHRKIKFVFATKNYDISEKDVERMKEFNIFHLEDNSIQYYTSLVKHLGTAARYQFLGRMFKGQTIKEMKYRIPSIKGKMGGLTYYSFVIDPENLLKISYILHQVDVHDDSLPSYQRIIKKNRLSGIRKFINDGGFFPNSIIVSFEAEGRSPRFDQAPSYFKGDYEDTQIGILHLPRYYRSAYIIDGQHRLYGYSDSKYANNNQIPVVAFVNLDKTKQIELFMQINENQKAVPKNLRNTLNADLLWEDKDKNNQREALRLRIAMKLGQDPKSPLFNKVHIGENEKKSKNTVTLENIEDGLKASKFFNTYSKNVLSKNGFFDKENNEKTFSVIYKYINSCFSYLKENLTEAWEADPPVLTSNNSINALFRILGDIVESLIDKGELSNPIESLDQVTKKSLFYIDALVNFFKEITPDQQEEIRTAYGAGGKLVAWRIYQREINKSRTSFNPDGLSKWLEDNSRQYIVHSFEMINAIENLLKKDFKAQLSKTYGEKWFTLGLPEGVFKSAISLASAKDYEALVKEGTTDPWDCLTLVNYRDIAIYRQQWEELFETRYTKPGEENLPGGKKAKTRWMYELNKIRNKSHHNNPVSKSEYDYLTDVYDWLIEKRT
ncbi:MAG: DGQHR domain-containing protein [Sphaerochaetaceae bacterium]